MSRVQNLPRNEITRSNGFVRSIRDYDGVTRQIWRGRATGPAAEHVRLVALRPVRRTVTKSVGLARF